ncbi:MAG TPA: RNA polymerase sigma factor [Ktedonobacterales bacterium]|jgi:RNA polymerase sigma-70 factor (ECF subfamily)|nr:RNA polymerase sigma factor [Ktedonobacterales bacterium]
MAVSGVWRRLDWRARRDGWLNLLAALLATDGQGQAGRTPDRPPLPQAQDSSSIDPAEFEGFFRQHERAVYACLWRLTGDPQAARDLTQETFVRAWRHYEQARGYEQPRAWLLRVATNLAFSAHRRNRARPSSIESLTDAETPARSDPTHRLAERDAVERALLALPLNQRAALTLREVYGFSCTEIGATLGISRDAVKMALYRGREGFRRHYLRQEEADHER